LPPEEITEALSGKRVLIVDDVPANRRLLEKIFVKYGAGVVATIGRHAEEAFAREPFDLAVLDYMMPGIDGITLAQRLRERTGTRSLPMLLVSSAQLGAAELPAGLFAAVATKPIRNLQFASSAAEALLGNRAPLPVVAAQPVRQGPEFAQARPLRILVVDDNAVNLRVMKATLTSIGYAPTLASDAKTALAALGAEKFDLVLMDVQMPEIDGHEATRRLRDGRAGELNRDCRVVALTAGALEEERDACFAAGMNDFLTKPVSRPELLRQLAQAADAMAG
jgi:CheY-like chemotaxis protein